MLFEKKTLYTKLLGFLIKKGKKKKQKVFWIKLF